MNSPTSWKGFALGFVVLCGTFSAWPGGTALADDTADDGTQKTYYWQGNQLNNLSRLSAGYTDFEDVQKHAKTGRDANQYLSTIREQMAHQAALNAKEKTALDFSGQLAGNPLEVLYGPAGIQVILHADLLFDESTASLKAGALDVLSRLETLLEREGQKPLHLLIVDSMESGPGSRNLDAERSLEILTALQMPLSRASPED